MSLSPSSRSRLKHDLEVVWPQLTRFYGLTPKEIAQLPRPLITAYFKAITEIQAREDLRAIQVSTYPHMSKADAQALQRRLVRKTGYKEPVSKPANVEEAKALYEGAGIGFTVVGPEGEETA